MVRGFVEMSETECKDFSYHINYKQRVYKARDSDILLLSYGSYGPDKKRMGAWTLFTEDAGLRVFMTDLRFKQTLVYDRERGDAVPVEDEASVPQPGDPRDGRHAAASGSSSAPSSASLSAADTPSPNEFIVNRLNNRRRFPYESGVFFKVVMRKGLCKCHATEEGCGGLHGDAAHGINFLFEVARVLSREPGAAAFLHGVPKHTSIPLWSDAARTIYNHFQGLLHVGLAIDSRRLLAGIKLQWSSRASLAAPERPISRQDRQDRELELLKRSTTGGPAV
eukprot:c4998_g1_i1.p1 GENE.c4998_g1_i1~~c4998_g1_i1.p1  ORF type:complete len:297 (+),score=31.49 c4998_g1_i1:54-893(+)